MIRDNPDVEVVPLARRVNDLGNVDFYSGIVAYRGILG
jgi:hypothetical protein